VPARWGDLEECPLLSARPFRVGDRVRFAGLGMDVEGALAAHGLLHVTLYDGDELVPIPHTSPSDRAGARRGRRLARDVLKAVAGFESERQRG
jgi:small-conductance mechanosensitive channel